MAERSPKCSRDGRQRLSLGSAGNQVSSSLKTNGFVQARCGLQTREGLTAHILSGLTRMTNLQR